VKEPGIDSVSQRNWWKEMTKRRWIKALVAIVILLCLYFSLKISVPLMSRRSEEIRNAVKMTVAFTQPGVSVRGGGMGMSMPGGFESKNELKRMIGDRDWDAGLLVGEGDLFGSPSFTFEWAADRNPQYMFKLPVEGRPPQEPSTMVWERLKSLPSGIAAEMAFSLDNYYDLDKILQLSGKHLAVSWYALDTGERFNGPQDDVVTAPFGIDREYLARTQTGAVLISRASEPLLGSFIKSREEKTVVSQATYPQGYIDNVAWLSEHESFFRAIAPTVQCEIPIDQRCRYLRENGLKTYGIVVQGPVEELLALKDVPQLREPQLGPVVWWLP
jgi:hypothetical protein